MPDVDAPITKNKLREHFLGVRNRLSQEAVMLKSKAISEKLVSSEEFRRASTVHTYIPIEKNNEADTYPIIENCLKENKKVVVPKIKGEGELNHFELTSFDNLHKNDLGIPEPEEGDPVPIRHLDLIVVPMVAGDNEKNRLGYGKGFYDRFLDKTEALKIGVLFDCQMYNEILPVESFDIPLDILLTESKRIE